MNRMPAVIAAIATLAGVVIGGVLNHYFAVRTIGPTAQIRETTDAYADYMNAAVFIVLNSSDPSQQAAVAEARTAAIAAKARIAMYGHPSVISAMVEFDKQNKKSSDTADLSDVFLSIVHAMRKHLSNDDIESPLRDNIKTLLF